MDNKEFIDYLRKGVENYKTPEPNSEGGYLIPEFLPCALPGLRTRLWRELGRVCYFAGFSSVGKYCYDKGTGKFNVYEYLTNKRDEITKART